MKLTTKLVLLFLLLTLVPLAIVGYVAYNNSRDTIEQNTFSRLVSNTILKLDEFNRWLDTSERRLQQFAGRPLVRNFAQILTEQRPTDPIYRSAYDDLHQNHFMPFLDDAFEFLEVSLLDSRSGLVLASSNSKFEGTYRQNEPYFIEGQKGAFIGNVRYVLSLEQAAMYISTPVKSESGDVIAVLAGQVDLSIMSDIMRQESGLNPTEESYMVNSFNFFVTDPKLGDGDFALKQAIYTVGVNACLGGKTEVGTYNDYRNVPVIGAYRWIPERQLCILTEVDQAEAFAPINHLRNQLLGIGSLIAVIVVGLGLVFAHTITEPIQELVAGTKMVGQGNLGYRINIASKDEIGELATAFNQMIARRQQMEVELKQARNQLEQRVAERTAELQKSEKKYRDLVDYAPVGVYQTTVSGDILYVNNTFARFMDFASAEQMRQSDTWARYKNKEDRKKFIQQLQNDGVVTNFETELLTGSNRPVHVLISGVLGDHFISGMVIDISERKQAEQALQESERTLSILMSNLPGMAYRCQNDIHWTMKFVSEGCVDLTGYRPEDLIDNQTVAYGDLIHPEDRDIVWNEVQAALQTENFFELTYRLISAEGVEKWIWEKGQGVYSSEGMLLALEGFITDITKRKRAEEQFRLIVEAMPNAIVVVDRAGQIVLVNAQSEVLFGYDRDELIGQSVDMLVPARYRRHHSKYLADFLTNPQARAMDKKQDLYGLCKDGREVPVEIGLSPMRDEEGLLILAAVVDITERKRAEMEIERSRRWLERIAQTTPDIIFVLDIINNRNVYTNRSILEILGYSPEEFGQLPDILQKAIAPEELLQVEKFYRNMAEAKSGEVHLLTHRTRHKNGSIRWIENRVTPFTWDENGNLKEVIGLARDITERKQAEQDLAQYAGELVRSNEELQQFAYVASHDLQEPLRMVASYLQLLERRYRDKLDDDAQEFIDYAVDGSNRMKQLINDLLTYSRVGTHGKPFEPTDCGVVLNQVLDNLELTIADNQAVITHDPLPTVLADASQLLQLFQNLIVNALKYRSQDPPRINIGIEQRDNFWYFSVSDNGIGIDPEFFDHIFVIFQRLHNREEYSGTGIGLAVCKKIIERHGGRIWVESQPGQGSTFYFTIPV